MKILKRSKWLQKSAAIVVIAVFAVIGALHIIAPVSAVANYNVANFAQLQTALADVDPVINITITADFGITSQVNIPAGKTVTITSDATRHTLTRGFLGDLISIRPGASLSVTNLIIDGGGSSLANVNGNMMNSHGNLTLGQDVIIQNNYRTASAPAGIFVDGSAGGNLTMNGNATIRDNHNVSSGGGLQLAYGGVVNLNDSATIAGNSSVSGNGGGVWVYDATSILNVNDNAQITGNTAGNNGGGIYSVGTVTINGGTIQGNEAKGVGGGGIYAKFATVNLSGAVISGNIGGNYGGGIDLESDSILNVVDSEISGNSALFGGGGVNVDQSSFTMNGGKISGNSVSTDSGCKGGGGIKLDEDTVLFEIEDVEIMENSSACNGGGIFISGNYNNDINILNVAFANNVASSNGGAISIIYNNLAKLNVDSATTFSSNSAHARYQLAPIDQPTYNAHIFATAWSNSVSNGYNNYDISYTNGEQIFLVNFESNGGSNITRQEVVRDETVLKPANPTRSGYSFVGWFTDENLTNPYDFTTPVTNDLILYAKWVTNPTNPTDPTDPVVPGVPSTGWAEIKSP